MKDSQIFVTGGCGFIGANLVKFFLDKGGYEITAYDNLSTGSKENLDRAVSDSRQKATVRFIEGDVLGKERLEKETKHHTAIIHLAAHTNIVDSLENPADAFNINAIGTFNVLEAARKNNMKRFIYASSNAVVGDQEPSINEEKIPAPLSPYGASKLTGEALCSAYYPSYGIKTISLRFANCYGPYSDHKTSVVAKFVRRAKQGKPLEIYGDGNQTRDFIYAQDICQAIDLALNFDSQSLNSERSTPDLGLIFKIGTGKETKIIDLASIIKKLAIDSGLEAPETVFKDPRKGEIRTNYSDTSKAKNSLGFEAKMKLENGLKAVWNKL